MTYKDMPTAFKFSKVYINQRKQRPYWSDKRLFIIQKECLEGIAGLGGWSGPEARMLGHVH